jgi:hypothetical protein
LAGRFFKRRESKKSLPFPELGFAVSVEESMKDGTFTVLLGLRDRLPNYTRLIQIRFWRY